MLGRIVLLLSIAWVMGLTAELFQVLGQSVSGRDLILIGGGLFLLAKATLEIDHALEGEEDERQTEELGRVHSRSRLSVKEGNRDIDLLGGEQRIGLGGGDFAKGEPEFGKRPP